MNQHTIGNVGLGAFVAQGDNININIGNAFPAIDYRAGVADLLDYYSEQFVGREAVFEHIDAVLAQGEARYLLVEALVGYGKSALVAQLVLRNDRGDWPKRSHPSLTFFFIREERADNTPKTFLSAVNSQLLHILNSSDGVPVDFDAQRAQFTNLWHAAATAATAERPLLLLVDGLDEMAMEKGVTIANLMPSFLASHAYVVVFSRPNPPPQEKVPIEHPFRKAQVIRLDPLRLQDIKNLLQREDPEGETAAILAPRVLDVTRGEPLFARFICEDVAREGEHVLLDFGDHPPEEVEEYFRQQFEQLDSQAEGAEIADLLGLMLVSRGPMSTEEMADALGHSRREVRRAIQPIQRFLIGSERFELMHSQLRSAIARDFNEKQCEDYRHRLLAWCQSFADNGWPSTTPDYVLEHFAAHLREANDKTAIYALVNRRWMQLKAARTFSHRSFAEDVLIAADMAASEKPPNLVEEFRCSLAYATLGSFAAKLPDRTLGLLARMGHVTQAMGYAGLIPDSQQRSAAYRTIRQALTDDGTSEEAAEAARLALAAAGRIEDPRERAAALGGMAGVFAQAGDRARAEEVLEGALAAAEELTPVPGRRPGDELDRYALAVAEVARAAAMVGADAHLIQVVTAALDKVVVPLAAADQSPPNSGSSPAVGLVAALARLGKAEPALAALEPADPEQKNAVIGDAVKELAEEGKADQAAELAGQALAAGQIAEGGAYRLTDTVGALARAGKPGQALAMAERIAQPEDEAQALAAVAHAFSQAGEPGQARPVAERAVSQLRAAEVGSRLVALKQVAEMLARAGESDLAAQAAEDMVHDLQQAGGQSTKFSSSALAAVAMTYMSPDRTDLADLAVAASQDLFREVLQAGDQGMDVDPYLVAAVALACAWGGEAGRARQVAELARQPGQSTFVLSDLAKAYALTGDLDQAWVLANESSWIPFFMFRVFLWKGQPEQLLSLADRSPDPESRDAVLTDAARALLEAGELDKALTAAQRITEKSRQASIKRSALRALSDTNQPSQTVALFREVLTIERSTSRPAVLQLLQTACSAIAKLDERATLWCLYEGLMAMDTELVGSSEP
jgi:tetratricopeptide (TPR) repeat protein